VRFIICISDFGVFKSGVQYATPHCELGLGIKQLLYQVYSKPDYKFICSLDYKIFLKYFMYYGEYKIEMEWCDELFNILMDGKGDLYNIMY
jgi:hypothetical protein